MRALVVTWGPDGNLPPLLAAGGVLRRRGHDVAFLASGETCGPVQRLGFEAVRFARVADPDTRVAFEAQAEEMTATIAGPDLALDSRDILEEVRPDVAIVDCMLPAAIAAARASGTPVVSLVHFLYGLARTQMLRGGGGWTTDLDRLAVTHRALGLGPARDGLDAWEAPELVLVTAPRWLDVEAGAPDHVVYAGPLDVRAGPHPEASRPRVLLTFSTTVMDGQPDLIGRVCEAVAEFDVDAVLTLGPAVDVDAVRVPGGIEVLAFGDHDLLLQGVRRGHRPRRAGTVLRALAHGVPMLLLPLGRDQAFNAGRVEQLQAGIRLYADAPPERIRAALRALLAAPGFRAAAVAAADRIAAEASDRSAGERIERLVQDR